MLVDEPEGLLPILTLDQHTGWADLRTLVGAHLDPAGLSRLKGALSGTTRCVAVERHYIDRDYRDTFSQFYSKRFSTPDSRCIRLHFFDHVITRDELRSTPEAAQPHYLGYSVIRPTQPNSIGRTLLKPKSRPSAVGTVCLCTERPSVQGTELMVEGFPFISQDADVTVCAQAALWMLARYFSDRYPIYQETYPVQIGALTRDYSVGRLFPSAGLYVWQLAEALRGLSFEPVLYARSQYSQSGSDSCHRGNFEHLLYTYIESGIPVLAAFHNHVVVLFGHVSNYEDIDKITPASPGSPFVYSSELNWAYVGNDDNGIPYQLLAHTPDAGAGPDFMPYSPSEIEQFVAPLPEKVFLRAESVETLVRAILLRADVGYQALSPSISATTPILRLFLTTGRSFKRRLAERGMGHPIVADVYHNLPLPHFVWVCEISSPSIYPKSVLGEILWDATRNAYEPEGWIALHYPEVLILDQGSALNEPPDLVRIPLTNTTEYPIYRSNLRDIQ